MALLTLNLSSREAALKNLDKLPRLSPLLIQFLGLLAQPGCDIAELVSVVEKDALLSAQILQKANSAAFARIQPINSVHHAVAMLGVGTMRRFALGSSISNLFARQQTAASFSMSRFNLHSVATGTLVELLAEELPMESRNSAFIAGLLHDIGELLIAVHMPKAYEVVLAMTAVAGASQIECERELLGTDHAELSALAISRWELDAAINVSARHHHEPANAEPAEQVPSSRVGLTMVVHKADEWVDYLGMSVLPPRATNPMEAPSLEFPGIAYPNARVQERFQAEWKNLANLFQ